MLEPGPVRTVARIIDSETLGLDDGSEVRLIGALGARASDAHAAPGQWPPETAAIKVLSDLVLGKAIKLAFGGRRLDRYGRHLAHVFLKGGGDDRWVQGELLTSGAARAYALPGSTACGPELIAHEQEARNARRGLWANGVYRPKPADRAAYLMTLRNRFERVEGIVASVSRTKSAIYLNFGTDWKSDFTARVAGDALAAHAEWEKGLMNMKGRSIVVRGWIERRNGPMIDVVDPSQIETTPPPPEGPDSAAAAAAAGGSTDPKDEDRPKELRPAPPLEKPGATDL